MGFTKKLFEDFRQKRNKNFALGMGKQTRGIQGLKLID